MTYKTMTSFKTFLDLHCIRFKVPKIETKKKALEAISQLACDHDTALNYSYVLQALNHREKLGSTAIGYNVAIPHARIKGLDEPLLLVMHLENPILFDDTDEKTADLFFTLLFPEEASKTHLKILSTLAESLQDTAYRQRLRAAKSGEELYQAAIS